MAALAVSVYTDTFSDNLLFKDVYMVFTFSQINLLTMIKIHQKMLSKGMFDFQIRICIIE